jgi:hypothetical protein
MLEAGSKPYSLSLKRWRAVLTKSQFVSPMEHAGRHVLQEMNIPDECRKTQGLEKKQRDGQSHDARCFSRPDAPWSKGLAVAVCGC